MEIEMGMLVKGKMTKNAPTKYLMIFWPPGRGCPLILQKGGKSSCFCFCSVAVIVLCRGEGYQSRNLIVVCFCMIDEL